MKKNNENNFAEGGTLDLNFEKAKMQIFLKCDDSIKNPSNIQYDKRTRIKYIL